MVAAFLAAALLAGCARSAAPPTAEDPTPRPLDLSGITVLVLPVQAGPAGAARPGSGDALDAEIAFWLAARAPAVNWVMPGDLEQILRRSPMVRIDPRRLPVSGFRYQRIERIGDPLYGELRRLALLADAPLALLPVAGGYVPRADDEGGRVELAAALIDTFGGEVLWFGVVAGDAGSPDDAAVYATAAQALAGALLR